eukprot:SAG31_NODE_19722_length_593_cov_1.117409_1_plen_102_part_10
MWLRPQAHLAAAGSVDEAKRVLCEIKNGPHASQAHHQICAYRVASDVSSDTMLVERSDDDGEAGAGSKLLGILRRHDVRGVIVVVSRWWGGINLGPIRFVNI